MQRTCVGCGAVRHKRKLLRVARVADGQVVVDPRGDAQGRGAYTCPIWDCISIAFRRNQLQRALRCDVPMAVYKTLLEHAIMATGDWYESTRMHRKR